MQNDLFTSARRDQSGITRTPAHTPGPWRVYDVFTDLEIVTDSPTADETESLVQFKGQRNARANARVMAAGPCLLERLEWLMNEAIPGGNRFLIDMLPEDKRDGYRKCADVLARARGQS
jgi:hypothetical protein